VGPGAEENPEQDAAAAQESRTEDINTEYLVSESVQEVVRKGASIERLSVAAFVDLPDSESGQSEGARTPLSLEDVTRIIKEAVGFDESRGDSLNVVQTSFEPLPAQLASTDSALPAWVPPLARYGAIGLLALVLLFIAHRVLRGLTGPRRAEVLTAELLPADAQTVDGRSRNELIREQIMLFVEQRPDAAGRLLEGWIEGEE
jgi:flagellar M-ring protein FliF